MFLVPDAVDSSAPALVDGATGAVVTYGDLRARVDTAAAALRAAAPRGLALCLTRNDVESVVAYLAAVDAGHAVLLLDAATDDEWIRRLIDSYTPEIVLGDLRGDAPADYRALDGVGVAPAVVHVAPIDSPVHEDLGVLLTTSGTTGSPKLVRLSRTAVAHNATSIAAALGIDAAERAITSLPINYSYGLSVLDSHLAVGATVVMTDESVLMPTFWDVFRAHACTSFAGVPYSYAILKRTGFDPATVPSLRTMTQAGGKLAVDLVEHFWSLVDACGGRFFVMYGQTEATARMTVLPAGDLPARLGSVGRAVPGGRLETVDERGEVCAPGTPGEVVYHGPNVMHGYAMERADLARGDDLHGRLETGDVGVLDPEGYLTITGRLKRIAKVYGVRVDLDEIEHLVTIPPPVAVVGNDEKIVVFCEHGDAATFDDERRTLARRLKLNHRAFEFRHVDSLPLGANGKIDYAGLLAEL